jgi:hypothetical protein
LGHKILQIEEEMDTEEEEVLKQSTSLEAKVAVLERDMTQMSSFFEKLDTTMEKLSDVSSSIKQLLAVHDLKINQHEEVNVDVYSALDTIKNDITHLKSMTEKYKWFFMTIGVLIAFILYKMNIIPWMPPFLG